MDGYLLPSDTEWTENKALLANLSHLNTEITRYILRQLDADARRSEPVPPQDEHDFGHRLVELGNQVQRRAGRREILPAGPVIEGEPGREPGMDHGP